MSDLWKGLLRGVECESPLGQLAGPLSLRGVAALDWENRSTSTWLELGGAHIFRPAPMPTPPGVKLRLSSPFN